MENTIRDFFLKPSHVTHKKYEAMRALCIDHMPAKEVSEKFGYSLHSINAMKRDFVKAINNEQIDSTYFFINKCAGRKPDTDKAKVKEKIIQLRKQNYSILDIKTVLHAEGTVVSHDYIHRVLTLEKFARLPKRTYLERKRFSSKLLKAPRSCTIDWEMDEGKMFHSERGIGVLPFLPLLAYLEVDKWIESAGYPGTSEISSVQNVLSFIALKLAGHTRYSADDLWAMDRGFGLFSGLNVVLKDSGLSSYSYRISRTMNRTFLKAMFQNMDKLGLLSGQVNMDFTAIPHWGDASVLENNWSGKRHTSLKSILAALCQDPETGIFCYSDAEIKHRDQAECVLEFVEFWKEKGDNPSCLIFDSKFTTYQNLAKLDKDGIKFITLRRRSKKLLTALEELPKEEWQQVKVKGANRKYETLTIHDSEITLPKIDRPFRQIIISDNGREKETFLLTNDRERPAPELIRQYGKRWNVEKGIAEQIEFFHLNSVSSSIVVKVDFDLAMTIAAHNFYRILAQDLEGFEKQSSSSLNSKFFNNGGRFCIQKDSIIIEMKKKRHLPLLIESLKFYKNTTIPWLNNKKLVFELWATS